MIFRDRASELHILSKEIQAKTGKAKIVGHVKRK